MYVSERLVRAAADLIYPADHLQIQILDDSTDETSNILMAVTKELRAGGHSVDHLHRSQRVGYKSGALAAGLEYATGEFIAIFDADFLPPPDFLQKTIPFFQDERVGFVQTRWGHINQEYSFLTLFQSLAIDAHFMVEQFSRSISGFWFNFNGTAGVWRRKTIEDAGNWRSDTLSEDLDLSYRAFLHGWRAVYLRDVVSPAELPVSMSAFRRQQHRWARGSLECAARYIPQIWNRPLPFSRKFEATLHLTGYGVHLLLCALVLLHPIVLLLSLRYETILSLFGIGIFFNLSTFAQAFFILFAQQQMRNRWWRFIPLLYFIAAAGAGMMVNTARAAFEILIGKRVAFERTPKFAITRKDQDWLRRRYQIKLDSIVFFELAFACLNALTLAMAFINHNYIIAFYALLFLSGLIFVSGLTILQAILVSRQRSHS
jgi:cellulose synthase/poly-beta-1,6-N-acetylglucosamine synthase-like glycosyltransferase